MTTRREFNRTCSFIAASLSAGLPIGALAASDDAITLAYPGDVQNWDPNSAASPVSFPIQRSVFDTPLDMSPDGQLVPGVVARYNWLDKQARVLELNLRPDVTFHNGDALTSDDLKFTFLTRSLDKSLMISGVWGSSLLESVETPTPLKAVFHFREPYVVAPKLMTAVPSFILPRRYFEKVGRAGFLAKPVGSGPYRLVDYQRDSRVVLEAYDKYWRGPAAIRRVTFQIIKDASARVSAIQSGQVDFASGLPIRETLRLGAMPKLRSNTSPLAVDYLIQMVNKGVFRDRNVRLAMHHAIDKKLLSKAFFGGNAIPLSMWEGPGELSHDPDFEFAYDPAKARALLAQSGYGPDKPLTIPFSTSKGVFLADYDIAQAIVQMWGKVGIKAELSVLEISKYYDMARADQLEAPMLYSWTNGIGDPAMWSGLILDPKKFFSVWRSDDISPRLDPLLREVDEEKRLAGFKAFDTWAVEQGYAMPLLKSIATVVHSSRLNYQAYRNGWLLPYAWSLKQQS